MGIEAGLFRDISDSRGRLWSFGYYSQDFLRRFLRPSLVIYKGCAKFITQFITHLIAYYPFPATSLSFAIAHSGRGPGIPRNLLSADSSEYAGSYQH